MKAMTAVPSSEGITLEPCDLPTPQPGAGDLLVRVHAAAVTPSELVWYPTTHTRDGSPRTHAVPGHEFSGVVEVAGPDVRDFAPGDEVFGMSDWFLDGATAELCLAQPAGVAQKPPSLSHPDAAALPISALTAQQGLFRRAELRPGERVLVHGGAGAVGLFAIQLAHLHGAHVLATASGRDLSLLQQLGVDQGIDYAATPFEEVARDVDVIFDTVGGDTLARSWRLLAPNGRLVTVAAQSESTDEGRAKEAFFIVDPDSQQLLDLAHKLVDGTLKLFRNRTLPLADAPAAYAGHLRDPQLRGKVVLSPLA